MQIPVIDDKIRSMYHTQEKWVNQLSEPIECVHSNAWFGKAWYFWYYHTDAMYWGNNSKRKTGYYEIYEAEINLANVFDTVFNEAQYLYWVMQVEKAAKLFIKNGKVPSLSMINKYFYDRGVWSRFDGILFQDISSNQDNYLVKGFQYKKRIQLAVYNLSIVTNFAFHYEGQCV